MGRKRPVKVVAILKIGALGDVLRTTAVLPKLREKYPDNRLWWITADAAALLLKRNPLIDQVLTLSEDIDQTLRGVEVSLCISLEDDPKYLKLVSKIRAQRIIGAYLAPGGRPVYTPDSAPWFDLGILNRDPDGRLQTANQLKAANRKTYPRLLAEILRLPLEGYPRTFEPILTVPPEEHAWAASFLREQGLRRTGPRIGFNPSAGSRWTAKRLSLERALKAGAALYRRFQSPILLFGGPEEAEHNRQFADRADFPVLNVGTDHPLLRFASLVNQADVVITSDSLCLHVANALGKRVVAFFGPTSSAEIELYGRGVKVVPDGGCDCFYAMICTRGVSCIDSIPPKAFADAAEQVLKISV